MSHLSNLKGKVHYQHDVPRCGNCRHVSEQKSHWNATGAIHWFRSCGLHGFVVAKNACCDSWQGKDGSTLE